jgi:carbonic anhydrase
MTSKRLSRRHLLSCSGLAVALPALAQEPPAQPLAFPKTAAEALGRLKDGNERFAIGKTRHAHQGADWRKHLVNTQKPFATILGCSDSRVPIELVFDQGFGDLFVVRVAGNVIAPDVVGSLAYAVEHLATSLIVVMGHEGCGAVTAAVQALIGPTKEPPGIKALLNLIEPGLPTKLPGKTADQKISAAVEANVRWSIKQLAALPEAKKRLADKRVTLRGAVYELTTGRVRFLAD